MKMRSRLARSVYDPAQPARDEGRFPLESLPWTSLRTPNCHLASARARGADWFIFRGLPAQGERRRGWGTFLLAVPIWTCTRSRSMTRDLQAMNARHLKQVPGRKSDVRPRAARSRVICCVRDCQWIAQLLQCELLKSSFIPPRAQRELRDLTRHQTQLVEAKTRYGNKLSLMTIQNRGTSLHANDVPSRRPTKKTVAKRASAR